MKHFSLLKTGFSVAKVVKTFSCIAQATETIDEFRYKMLYSDPNPGGRGEKQCPLAQADRAVCLTALIFP